jgi:diacylglycerol O-acyltransferase / wax synthase
MAARPRRDSLATMPTPDRLTALDATFLELEHADVSAHMHIGAVMVFEPTPAGGAPALADVLALLDERLDALPRYRRRLSEPRSQGLRRPVWEPDLAYDTEKHVRRAALPEPGGEAELLEWAGDFYSHRLDRRRPLWELVVLEGLRDGAWALCTKTHHCMVDGVGAVDAGMLLLDALSGALLHLNRTLQQSRALAELLVQEELIAAPRTSLNVPIGKHRRLVVARASLDELRTVAHTLGGTVNDVVLTLVTGALRELLLARREELPRSGLRAMVPVNLRMGGERLGNRVSSLFVPLPVAEPEPLARFHLVRRETAAAKAGRQGAGTQALLSLAELTPPVLHALAARSEVGTRLFNVTVTNVPGPPVTLNALGAPMREANPLVPLAAEHAVGVAVVSYGGGVVLCANCDRDAVPDAGLLGPAMESALRQLS